MTKEEQIKKEVDNRVKIHEVLQAESTQTQITVEYMETMKTEMCLKWLLSVADERKNKKLYDCITLLSKRFKKHKKLMSDLRHYEAKASYFEMMYDSQKVSEKQVKTLTEILIDRGL